MANQRNLRDVLVGDLNHDPLSTGAIISDAKSNSSLDVKIRYLDISGENMCVPVVL